MSDVEQIEQVEVEEVVAQQPVNTFEDSLKEVLRNALIHDGLSRGLKESVKTLTKGEAELVILVESVTEESIKNLIKGLAKSGEEAVPIVYVSDAKQLGEWAGLGKVDREGNARKVVGASVVVIKNFGVDSKAIDVVLSQASE
ncbi:hypothetical protein ACO0SA_002899 [Hanseniaspora valbyensis]|uniref:40S ribosomal protein S12 n=1 Tax=Hanseniaspora valbyensis NRRL Y-1626 TaxID=766949 RepID=A0A1B7TK65_9ASCO|nr:hypothetical protein HANVADRAFT_36049 [Hanseniaspora valbyensis NRRL Y-1626]